MVSGYRKHAEAQRFRDSVHRNAFLKTFFGKRGLKPEADERFRQKIFFGVDSGYCRRSAGGHVHRNMRLHLHARREPADFYAVCFPSDEFVCLSAGFDEFGKFFCRFLSGRCGNDAAVKREKLVRLGIAVPRLFPVAQAAPFLFLAVGVRFCGFGFLAWFLCRGFSFLLAPALKQKALQRVQVRIFGSQHCFERLYQLFVFGFLLPGFIQFLDQSL